MKNEHFLRVEHLKAEGLGIRLRKWIWIGWIMIVQSESFKEITIMLDKFSPKISICDFVVFF